MTTKRLHAIVHGRVQGVNFRWYTRQRAAQLGLSGWVRNLPDGRQVEVTAEGPADELADLVRFLHQGPPSARVEKVDLLCLTPSGEFTGFSVRYR